MRNPSERMLKTVPETEAAILVCAQCGGPKPHVFTGASEPHAQGCLLWRELRFHCTECGATRVWGNESLLERATATPPRAAA